jgi:hypothetical protein
VSSAHTPVVAAQIQQLSQRVVRDAHTARVQQRHLHCYLITTVAVDRVIVNRQLAADRRVVQ